MKVKASTYFWLFLAVVFVLFSVWKSYNGMELLKQAESIEVNKDAIYGWFATAILAIGFFIWRCVCFAEEKKVTEFLAAEKRREEELERRIKWANTQRMAEQERKWQEEQRVRRV